MKSARAAERFPTRLPLDARGRARRASIVGDPPRELWRLPEEDEPACGRLLALGQHGIGGFEAGGVDDDGAWLVRRSPEPMLAATLRSQGRSPMPWKRAVAIAVDLAEALSHAESEGIAPGPLAPDAVSVGGDDGRAWLLADAFIDERLGDVRPDATTPRSPLWCPPAQAEGAPWDAGADRYVLGLVLYKMLSGTHPFSGAGLRKALEAATRDAPPFEPSVAEQLPAGLMGLVLRMISPRIEERPESATTIADALSRFAPRRGAGVVFPKAAPRASRSSDASVAPKAERASSPSAVKPGRTRGGAAQSKRTAPSHPLVRAALPIAIGIAVALGALTQLGPAPARSLPQVAAPDHDEPIGAADLDPASCASCHPRQAAEWRRSVMGHSVKSPLFNALESLVEEQVGRDFDCPNGAGILRKTRADLACRDRQSGLPVSGSGGEHWCVNCHSPGEVLEGRLPPWDGRPGGDPRSRFPVRDLLGERGMEGISCGFCHQVHGPVSPRRAGYQGNPTWTSTKTGQVFAARPEDLRGLFGIANSGFSLDANALFLRRGGEPEEGLVHARHDEATRSYLASSEFCGSCHDVRLFGTDVIGAGKGENFKRLRNGYTEWAAWAKTEQSRGREPATCQGCHMSTFPGVCEPDPGAPADPPCPEGTRFSAKKPGEKGLGRVAVSSREATPISTHYLSGVDLPLSREYPEDLLDEGALDVAGIPVSAKSRRDLLLKATFRFELGRASASRGRLSIPIEIENIGGGHRVPAGFSQEREIWVHLRVTDQAGRLVYEVGRVDRNDEDLRDKVFVRVNTDPSRLDGQGRPEGLFGADVRDGPDVPQWSPRPELGGTRFNGRGLINFQNGFLRCVRCVGAIGSDGRCEPGPGQEVFRADRFVDGDYDPDTGECRSNLFGEAALFETYFPVGALDASRGLLKAPDAIIDTRSAPPNVPLSYTYDLETRGARGPFKVEARLLFRAFPPYLIRAFTGYERAMASLGKRPSGPLVDDQMLKRIEVVEIERLEKSIAP